MIFCMQILNKWFKDTKKIQVLFLSILFLVCAFAVITVWKNHHSFPVVNGCIDLQHIDFSSGKPVQLKGEWEFFDKKLIVTELLTDAKPDKLVMVPSYMSASSHSLNWGSYRIKLLHCPPEVTVSLSLRGMPSAYRIFLNGQSIEKSGLVSRGTSMKIEAGFSEDSSIPLRSSTCELVIEVSGQALPGLSMAPILAEKSWYQQTYQQYQAIVFLLFGTNCLFAIAYAMGLILTPHSGYSATMFFAILLLLWNGLSIDTVFCILCASFSVSYDTIVIVSYAARLLAWAILLRKEYLSERHIPVRSMFSVFLYTVLTVCLFAPILNFITGTTLWWMLADLVVGIMLLWRLYRFAKDHHQPGAEGMIQEIGLIFLWFGYALSDLAMAGRILFCYKIFAFIGVVLFLLSIYVIDRRRIKQIQHKALEAVKVEKELERAKTELALHQIKPHFLHNALMSIKVLCRRDPSAAECAVYDFAVFLRSNMKAIESSNPISFSDELKTIEGYLHIEKIRFGQRLHVVWDIREKDFFLPPLTIQPLVENAVCHGICQKMEGGTVTISSYKKDSWILIQIQDDGVGFDLPKDEDFGGIGIRNLRLRLKNLLNADLEIISRKGEGCLQIVRIPLEGGNNIENYSCR